MTANRSELRTAMMARVEVSWEEPHGAFHPPVSASMEDTSASGACLRLWETVPVGSTVFVKRPWEEIAGIARYCRNEGRSYVLGIQRIPKTQARNRSLTKATPFNIEPRPASSDFSPKPLAASLQRNASPSLLKPIPATPSPVSTIPLENPRRPHLDPRAEKRVPPPQTSRSNERRDMPSKWLGRTFKRQKEERENGKATAEATFASGPSNFNISLNHAPFNGNGKVPTGWQGDLQAPEDVYRAAGIMTPRLGYGIAKIIEMMDSEHVRGLPNDAKHAAIMMALDVAGISADDILRDATLRQDALTDYESSQRKSFEEHWARKAELNAQIQEELDRIKLQGMERIKRNLEEIASEKVKFATWQTMKREEAERIAEAVGLCSMSPASSSSSRSGASSNLAFSATAPAPKSS